jgi:hypothetical protein
MLAATENLIADARAARAPLLLEAVPEPRPHQLVLPAPWALVLAPRRPARTRARAVQPGRQRKCSPAPRARTLNTGKLSVRVRQGAYTRDLFREEDLVSSLRPRTRAECKDGPRPCPWIGCRHHLAITVHPERGSIKETFPHLRILQDPEGDGLEQLEQLAGTCSLDTADGIDLGIAEIAGLPAPPGFGGLLALHHAALSGKPLGQTPGGMTIEDAGERLNLSIERTRQLSALGMQEVRLKLIQAENVR